MVAEPGVTCGELVGKSFKNILNIDRIFYLLYPYQVFAFSILKLIQSNHKIFLEENQE